MLLVRTTVASTDKCCIYCHSQEATRVNKSRPEVGVSEQSRATKSLRRIFSPNCVAWVRHALLSNEDLSRLPDFPIPDKFFIDSTRFRKLSTNIGTKIDEFRANILTNLANIGKKYRQHVILELCKGVHCVDLGESFPTHSNACLLANFGFDTPENEPLEVRQLDS